MGFVILVSFSFHVYISMLIVAIAIGAWSEGAVCRGVSIGTGMRYEIRKLGRAAEKPQYWRRQFAFHLLGTGKR